MIDLDAVYNALVLGGLRMSEARKVQEMLTRNCTTCMFYDPDGNPAEWCKLSPWRAFPCAQTGYPEWAEDK